jgi:ABC-type Fe3+ transport system permease subunit
VNSSLLRSARPWRVAALLLALALVAGPMAHLIGPLLDFGAYRELRDGRIGGLFFRTLWMSLLSASISVAIGLPLALLATRTAAFGGSIVALLSPLPLLMPPLLLAQAWNGLTGFDGPWASVITLGFCYAPLPGLFAARALANQHAAAHESALLLGGRRQALLEMLRLALPAAAMGGALAFLFTSTDFAVPDYFAAIGERFATYPAEVFNRQRDQDFWAGARAAAPLVLLEGLVLYLGLILRDRWAAPVAGHGKRPAALHLGRLQAPANLLIWLLLAILLLLPLGRIVYETGLAGSEASGSWASRSLEALTSAIHLGRASIVRSLNFGLQAALIALALAPFLAHYLIRQSGRRGRLLTVCFALPLLTPAIGYGLGAILVANRPEFGFFYQSTTLVVLVMAGRFLPIAVFLLAERFQRVPVAQLDAARLAGLAYPVRLFRILVGPHRSAWFLAAGLVLVFSVRELDLAILLPGANDSVASRYFNALHFARDNFVAALGLLMALILFLPAMLYAAWTGLRNHD